MNWGWFVAAISLMVVNARIPTDLGFSASNPEFWIMSVLPALMFIFGMNHGRALLRSREREEKNDERN